jgi:mono/diheme cytochrome c family protein
MSGFPFPKLLGMNHPMALLNRAREAFMLKAAAHFLAGIALIAVGDLAQGVAPGFVEGVQPIFDRECVECHGPKERKAKLDLSARESYGALVNVPSREAPAIVRVKPGDPEQSYLWLKLEHRTEEGSGMPKGFFSAKRLAQKDLDVVKAWIAAGAQP